MVYLNLKLETLLFDHKNKKGNPVKIILNDLNYFLNKIENLKNFNNFEKNTTIKKIKFIRENTHKILFNKLWTNFNFRNLKKKD